MTMHEKAGETDLLARGSSAKRVTRVTGAVVRIGVDRATAAAGDRAVRFDRYLALAACAGAGGVGVTEAQATIIRSDAAWSATAAVSGVMTTSNTVNNFGVGGTQLAGFSIGAAVMGPNRLVRFGGTYTSDSSSNPARFRSVMPTRLAAGGVVGATGSFLYAGALVGSQMAASNFGPAPYPGAWGQLGGTVGNSIRGYLGFRFSNDGSTVFYGYFDLTISRSGTDENSSLSVTVHGWAYNSVAGQSITIGSPAAIPGGTGLAALAFGAAGLRGRRRSRN